MLRRARLCEAPFTEPCEVIKSMFLIFFSVLLNLFQPWTTELSNKTGICHLDYLYEPFPPARSYRFGDLPSSSLFHALSLKPLVNLPQHRSVFGLAVDNGRFELEWYVYFVEPHTWSQLAMQHPLVRTVPIHPSRIYLYSFTSAAEIDVYVSDAGCPHGRQFMTYVYHGYPWCTVCKTTRNYRWDGQTLKPRNIYHGSVRPEVPIWNDEIPVYLRDYEKHSFKCEKPDGRLGYYVTRINTKAFAEFVTSMPFPPALQQFVAANAHKLDHIKWDVSWNTTEGKIDKAAVYGIM